MQIRTTTDYAIRTVLHLARNADGRTLRDISDATGVPRDTVAQIAACLTRASILEVRSDECGVYSLARQAVQITLYDIAEAMGDDPSLPGYGELGGANDKQSMEALAFFYKKLQGEFEADLKRITVD